MNPLRAILIYLGIIFVGGALLAPWVYASAQWCAEHSIFFESIARQPFGRYVSRSIQLLALFGLWPFLRTIGVSSWRDAGLDHPIRHWRQGVRGGTVGLASFALIAGLALITGVRSIDLDHPASDFWKHLGRSTSAAIFVSILEEVLFRGALFGALRKVYQWPIALFVSSLLFAGVHFLQKAGTIEMVTWNSGLLMLAQMAKGFLNINLIMPAFINLTVVGIILGLAYQFTGSLYFSIGLHAGWIFWQKSYGFLTRGRIDSSLWLWGGDKLIDGWLTLLVLILTMVVLPRLASKRSD